MVLSTQETSMEENLVVPVRVAVRIRPFLPTDRLHEMVCAQANQSGQVLLGDNIHEFDHSFGPDSSQSQVFQTSVAPLMDHLLEGFDTSVILFGHAHTGKSYTLFGPGFHCLYSETEYGIIPRAARHIFSRLLKARNTSFCVKVSFLEISNGVIRDLLSSNQYQQEVSLTENSEKYPVVIGAQEVECANVSEVFSCLHAGMNARHISWSPDGNIGSHYIFQILVEQKWVTPEGLEEYRLSVASFADLGSTINHGLSRDSFSMDSGLTAVSNIVSLLTQYGSRDECYNQSILSRLHECYQQSTLAHLLKESFGGRCYSLVICCISPASLNFDESLMTLRFAERAKNIQNTPKVSALRVFEEQINGKQADQLEEDQINADTFGLEFAASQWYKLVHNAEGLFKTLVNNNMLSEAEKERIEQWLCLKEECEEVVASDEEDVGMTEKENRQLEKIDEVTETEEKTDSSKEGDTPLKPVKVSASEKKESKYESETESEEESENDNQRPDFNERLEEHMDKLRETTEEAVAIHEDILQIPETEETDSQVEETGAHPVRLCVPKGGRRRSIHPEFDIEWMRLTQQNVCSQPKPPAIVQEETEDDEINKAQETHEQTPPRTHLQHLEPQQQLKLLSAANEAKQNQIKEVLIDLEGAYKQLSELQATIQIKEQFIGDMIKNSDTRTCIKQKFQRKRTKLEEAYYKIRTQLAQAENALSLTNSLNDDKAKLKKEVEKYKKLATHYEKRFKDMEVIKQIAGDSAKKVLELENSLQTSKRQMEKLKQRLERAEARKLSLEQELLEDQNKIKELEDKFQLQEQEHERERSSASASDGDRLKWMQSEEERLMKLRESSQRFQEQLIQQQSILEKRESFLKEKVCLERQRNKSIMEVSARISHLDQVLKEKSTDLEHIKNAHEKEALRLEIHNLRSTRDCLIEQRCTLDTKFQKDKILSTMEERKLLECDEAIEAIDAAIEYKNELICGRKGGLDTDSAAREKGEQMLMARLNKLSPMEMRMLLYKYFQKVIDLRENGRKMEVQLTEKETCIDSQTWQIQVLTNALHQQRLRAEQQMMQIQRQYQEKIHLMLRHFAEDTSTVGGASSSNEAATGSHRPETRVEGRIDPRVDIRTEERADGRAESRAEGAARSLRKRFLRLEVPLARRSGQTRERSRTPETIPQKNLKTLQGSGKSVTAKVTVERKKLIIMQQESRKPTASDR